ncbi:hypothetical protein JCM19037_4760 [Geomicrobium sp. JCM 19037]|uniref:hypothetical protein n=1 Tax=Geomicrobium sp. JCM 19037 TaxID=1460634 RepID=UPI00045F224D|nr:hypothetical protein [Geomicrobium sp. JCM 19037]GAK06181.1 hypothetical protein JCM19037_4760 [Geomicrobium sp. JCM 19037]
MSNAYEVSKRVFEEYFLKRNHVQTAVTPGVKEYNRGSVSNPEYAPIYMGGRYYRMASFMIFLSQLEYEAREVHKEDSLAVEVSDELSKAINAIFDETSEGGEMEGYLRDGPMDGGTPGISALTASLVFIKGLNGNLCDNVKERVEDMLDQCWDWSDRHYREHTWSFMDDHTIEYMVDHLIVDDEQSFPNARYPMNGVMWYAYAMAMDSYLNHNGQVYDQPYGRTARRFKNMGIYIQEINYDVSQFSKNLTAGKQHLTGAGRPVLIAGYTSWTGMHLGMLEYGLKATMKENFMRKLKVDFKRVRVSLLKGSVFLLTFMGWFQTS